MTVATFDTLKYANKLKAAGVPGPQAEAEAEALADALHVNLRELVTRDDLKLTRDDLKRDIQDVRREIQDVRRELKEEMTVQRLTLEKKVDVAITKLSGEIFTLRLMFGAIMTGIMGILIRLFLYPGGRP